MMPGASKAASLREICTGEAFAEGQAVIVDTVAGRRVEKVQQLPPAMAHTAVANCVGWPSPHHGGPRENRTRMGVGAIAAVGTKAPLPQ